MKLTEYRTMLYLPQALYAQTLLAAKRQKKSLAAVIREAIAQYLQHPPKGHYAKALKAVSDALAAADAGLQEKQTDWPGFVTEAAVESIKAAAVEYEAALVDGRIAKPVEYQDARGFIWQAGTS